MPIEDVDCELLHRFTLADDGRMRTLAASGVRFNKRYYAGEWMHGEAEMGVKVCVRFIPHHDHEIEVFDAEWGRNLGPAHPSDAATEEQRRAHRRRKTAEKRRLARAMPAVRGDVDVAHGQGLELLALVDGKEVLGVALDGRDPDFQRNEVFDGLYARGVWSW